MKKFLLGLVTLVVALGMFSSCEEDEDRDLAIVLSGEWEGDFGAFYTISINGSKPEPYRAEYTRLQFTPFRDYSKRGYGTEIDFYGPRSPYPELAYKFRWEVEDGVIYIEFIGHDNMDLVLNDFKMDSKWFTGKIDGKRFSLEKMTDFYDWTPWDDYFVTHPDQPSSSHEMTDRERN